MLKETKNSKEPKEPKITEEDLHKQPALGVNKTYDEAVKWFENLRLAKQANLQLAIKTIENINQSLSQVLKEKETGQGTFFLLFFCFVFFF